VSKAELLSRGFTKEETQQRCPSCGLPAVTSRMGFLVFECGSEYEVGEGVHIWNSDQCRRLTSKNRQIERLLRLLRKAQQPIPVKGKAGEVLADAVAGVVLGQLRRNTEGVMADLISKLPQKKRRTTKLKYKTVTVRRTVLVKKRRKV
jgi:hypothetical protein